MASMATDTSTSLVPSNGRSPSSWGLGDGQAIPWEYAPAPESRDVVKIHDRYGVFIGGEWLDTTESYETISPSSEATSAMASSRRAHSMAVWRRKISS